MIFEEYLSQQFPEDWDTEWAEADVLQEGMSYALNSGGKRLRPLLCLKMCDALGGDREQAKVFARAIEVFHNFTLVHDDIMDKDVLRRGEETVWMKYGLSQGIDIGDGLHAAAYGHLIENRELFDTDTFSELLAVFNEADKSVIDGQSEDIAFRGKRDISEDEYIEMVQKKTGALLAAALQGAGIIAGVDEETMEHIEILGNRLGPAFQIRDDVIDIVGEKGRKNGNDIREGKRSLIVVKALEKLPVDKKEELLYILDKEKEETDDADVKRAVELFEEVDAIEAANRVAEELMEEAVTVLEDLSEGYDMSDVQEITEFLVDRRF